MRHITLILLIFYSIYSFSIPSPQNTQAIFNSIEIASMNDFTEIYKTEWCDYDDDKDLDLLVSGYITSNSGTTEISRIYKNTNGIFNYLDKTLPTTKSVWTDINNDNRLDIVYYNRTDRTYKYLKNNTLDNFTDEYIFTPTFKTTEPEYFALRDYNSDGLIDIAYFRQNNIRILYNEGNGTMREVVVATGVSDYSHFLSRDFDNDGDMDFMVRKNGTTFIENKLNSFSEHIINSYDADLLSYGDFDNDGRLDVVFENKPTANNYLAVYWNNPNGAWSASNAVLHSHNIAIAFAGDFDNDGNSDIFFYGRDGELGLARNLGNKKFEKVNETFSSTKPPQYNFEMLGSGYFEHMIPWGDFDNDGDLDLLIGNTLYINNSAIQNSAPIKPTNLNTTITETGIVMTWDRPTDTETPSNGLTYNIYIGTQSKQMDVYPLLSDIETGYRKIVQAGNAGNTNSWLVDKLPDGIYYWSVQAIDNGFKGSPFADEMMLVLQSENFFTQTNNTLSNSHVALSTQVIDFDNDNDHDVFFSGLPINNSMPNGYEVLTNDGSGNFSENIFTETSSKTQFYENIDMDNNGNIDFVFVDNNSTLKWKKNNGDGTFSTLPLFAIANEIKDLKVADMNNDGLSDLIVLEENPMINGLMNRMVKIYQQLNNQLFIAPVNVATAFDIFSIEIGDVDKNQQNDVICRGSNSTIYLNKNYAQLFDNVVISGTIVCFGDFDASGTSDFIVSRQTGENAVLQLYTNNGYNLWNPSGQSLTIAKFVARMGEAGDFNNDGKLDYLLCGSSTVNGSTKVIRNNGNGVFEALGRTDLPENIDDAYWTDFDHDGDIDLVLDNYFYRNNALLAGTIPTEPNSLKVKVEGSSATFEWKAGSDTETATKSLTYNLFLGSTPTKDEFLSSYSNLNNGFLKISASGNTSQNLRWKISNLKAGTYYFSVQSVDDSYTASPFATPLVFHILTTNIEPVENQLIQENIAGNILTVNETPAAESRQWKYGTSSGMYTFSIANATQTTYAPLFEKAGNYFVMCESRIGEQVSKSNEVRIEVFEPEIHTGTVEGSPFSVSMNKNQTATFSIAFDLIGKYQTYNTFTAYLSDKNGGWSNEIQIGAISTPSNQNMSVTISSTIPSGTAYRIRIKSTHPEVLGTESNIFEIIQNNPPENILLSTSKTDELQLENTLICTFQTVDIDEGDSHTYQLIDTQTSEGSDNSYFKIIDNMLYSNAVFDFETKNLYQIKIQTTDHLGEKFSKAFSIEIENINERPEISVNENISGWERSEIQLYSFTLNDVDIYNEKMTVRLETNDGILILKHLDGITIETGANQSSAIQLSGNIHNIRLVLNNLYFVSNKYFMGEARISLVVSDNGNIGKGGENSVNLIVLVNVIPLPPEIIVQPKGIKGCFGDVIVLKVEAAGAGELRYQWFKDGAILWSEKKSDIELTINSIAQDGNYYCQVSNPSPLSPTSSGQASIELRPQELNADIEDITLCYGDKSGEMNIKASGGWGNYLISINEGEFTPQTYYPNLPPADYLVAIKDDNQCITKRIFSVVAPPLLRPAVEKTDILCNQSNNGKLTVAVAGGTPPFNIQIIEPNNDVNQLYLFENNKVNKKYDNLKPGIFTINITDKFQCDTVEVISINEPQPLMFEYTTTKASCYESDDARFDFNLAGGTQPYQFYWTNEQITKLLPELKGGEHRLHLLAENPNGVTGGNYEFYILDQNQCDTSLNVVIERPDKLQLSVVSLQNVGANSKGSIQLAATGGTAPYSYSVDNRYFQESNQFNLLNAGNYYTSVFDQNHCTAFLSAKIEAYIPPPPVADFNFVSGGLSVYFAQSCQNASAYFWNFGDGFFSNEPNPTHTYAQSGSYTVSLKAMNALGTAEFARRVSVIGTAIEPQTLSSFKLYPNPASDGVTIEYSDLINCKINVYDICMKKLKSHIATSGMLKIDLQDLAKGMYFIEISKGDERVVKKLILR